MLDKILVGLFLFSVLLQSIGFDLIQDFLGTPVVATLLLLFIECILEGFLILEIVCFEGDLLVRHRIETGDSHSHLLPSLSLSVLQ